MKHKLKLNLKLKGIITILLVSGLSSTVKANNDSAHLPPEVSAAEAKVSFWDMPYLKKAFIDSTPSQRNDNIEVGQLGTDGGKKQQILKLAKDIANKKYGLIDSLLIAQNNKLLFESYYLRGRVDLPHMQASSTKSYVSLAIGRAIQLGYLTMNDLNKPVVSFLKDLDRSKLVEGAQKITLHKALSMQSGMQITREQLKTFKNNPSKLKGQGQIQTFLENSPPISAQTQQFKYTNTDPILVMQVLDAVVPGSAKDFIKTELLDKMGISNYEWKDDVSGLPMGPYSSSMTSRNMIKWGTLVQNNGKWNGQQLISADYITKATNSIVYPKAKETFFISDTVTTPGYGYYFWQANMKIGNKNYSTRSAQGGGGQYIILIDELDLVIVLTAHERDDKSMQIAAQRVLPAFI
ncbi:hypothetical protein PSECIP111951_00069 [Pseudoalteromonas holothuriae]|uniref:Beta-lactamase-related domain-containing protein n=1 Tax=Pseudoalteromonas holothuriae TaxID=2963714 RepID=A0A9W4VN50_9GAMM|nr:MULTISPECIES: serine hydrolase [unclassified Pseudoalteromonas]CAH9049896.1 hypothetical protein PSECIP111951_00069 [Pseudoalteromonas sp. CIP111951]CAH9052832.1 hypothetical protein PSECIP111854_01051 [Pseudoalteromonas sp. CIP111854]